MSVEGPFGGARRGATAAPSAVGRIDGVRLYHRDVPNVLLLALIGGLFLVLLIPTRRLQQGGWPPRVLAAYLGSMILFGLLLAELRAPARLLVPIFIVAYIAPFVTVRTGLERMGLRNPRDGSDIRVERPPTKQVSGPSRDVDTGPAEEEESSSE